MGFLVLWLMLQPLSNWRKVYIVYRKSYQTSNHVIDWLKTLWLISHIRVTILYSVNMFLGRMTTYRQSTNSSVWCSSLFQFKKQLNPIVYLAVIMLIICRNICWFIIYKFNFSVIHVLLNDWGKQYSNSH